MTTHAIHYDPATDTLHIPLSAHEIEVDYEVAPWDGRVDMPVRVRVPNVAEYLRDAGLEVLTEMDRKAEGEWEDYLRDQG